MIAAETASEQAVSALIAAHADVNIKANDKVRTTLVARIRAARVALARVLVFVC